MKKLVTILLIAIAGSSPACRKPAPSPGLAIEGPIAIVPEPVSYDLTVDADTEAGTIAGDCVLGLRNASTAPIFVVPLNLYRLMVVDSVADAFGRALPFTQNVRIFEDWKELQVNHIRVALEPALEPGRATTLRIRYGGPLLGYAEAMRYVKDHIGRDLTLIRTDSYVYPQIGVPSWKTNRAAGLKSFGFTVSLTVPSPLVVANAGDLVSRSEKDGRLTYMYKSRVPSWRIDVAAADYAMVEAEGGKLRIFSFPDDRPGAQKLLDSLKATVALYSRWFGALPDFRGLTVIEVPAGYGSQADVAAVIQEAGAFQDPAGRYTFYHELAHLWDVPANDPLPSRFESEGLAMFLQHLVQEKLEGKSGAVDRAVAASLARLAKSFGEHPDWKTTAMIDYGKKDLTDLSYPMGQILFYLLDRVLGEEAFLATVAGFDRDYRATGATSAQFVTHFKKAAGVDLDALFDDWVFTPRAAGIIVSGAPLGEIVRRYR